MARERFLCMIVHGRIRLSFRIKTQILSCDLDIGTLGVAIVTVKFYGQFAYELL